VDGPPPGTELRTRTARLRVGRFEDLPGWAEDDPSAGWQALLQSCKVLSRRPTWSALCAQASALGEAGAADEAGKADRRRFYQRAFTVLRVLNPDASAQGAVTGYFEPLLAGSAQPQGAFRTAVYGVPRDLLLLDRRALAPVARSGVVAVLPVGSELRPLSRPEPGSLRLDLDALPGETSDRWLRLRRDGDRALPYYTRAELAALERPQAPVIAWVDDPVALYAMQMQGSGRIRFPDGRVLRLEYGEQNGHPFRPQGVTLRPAPAAPKTRGVAAPEEPQRFDLALDEDAPAAASSADVLPEPAAAPGGATRGLRRPTAPGRSASDALVDELLPAPPPGRAKAAPAGATAAPGAPSRVAAALARDPSFVFFRVAADQRPAPGPVGALGVPLTAGRSVAVDPRSTPLGYPIFLSARGERGEPAMRKLVFAQDTGGAIRGAVRADHFWGFGQEAGRQAARTRFRGEMWLLMPRAEALDLFVGRGRTRSLAPVCLLPDDEHCVE
jgi:membrane-bound lytic murein transglycosylase A